MAQQPCLPVSRRRKRKDGPEEVNFHDIQSMEATDYLSLVVNQANQLPEVFVSTAPASSEGPKRTGHIPIEGSAASLAYLTSDRTTVKPPPTVLHAPDGTAWVDQTLDTFSRLRQYIDQCKEHGVGGKQSNRVSVPPLKDRPSWHIFFVGTEEARGNKGSYFDNGEDDDDDDDNKRQEEELEEWEKSLPSGGYSPTISLLLQMDQVMIRRVLGHLVHYVREGWSAACPQRAAWIYALLARLERPIHRDDAAMLFGLLKTLTRARAENKATEKLERVDLAQLNVLIAIVGIYFEQGGGYANVMAVK